MIDFVRVGTNISNLRKSNNYSQEDLAKKLYVTRQALSKWENGVSVPSIDSLLEICRIFAVSFEKLLGLNENAKIIVDENNIFKNHERNYVIKKIISGELCVIIPDVFYQFSPSERLVILKAIKDRILKTEIEDLWVKLTQSEQKYLGGMENEFKKSNN